MKATASYTVTKWSEHMFDQISSERKMTKATVEYAMTGDLIGSANVEYLMFYKYFNPEDQHKSSATYIGLMRFKGSINGKEGSFVIEDHGAFENGVADSTLQIIAGSGMEALKDISGSGFYKADENGLVFEIEYEL